MTAIQVLRRLLIAVAALCPLVSDAQTAVQIAPFEYLNAPPGEAQYGEVSEDYSLWTISPPNIPQKLVMVQVVCAESPNVSTDGRPGHYVTWIFCRGGKR